jgi:hypothetical protein
MADRGPLLPRPIVIAISVAVLAGWLATVWAALNNPAASGPLITVSGLLAMVIGGIGGAAQGFLSRHGPAAPPTTPPTVPPAIAPPDPPAEDDTP